MKNLQRPLSLRSPHYKTGCLIAVTGTLLTGHASAEEATLKEVVVEAKKIDGTSNPNAQEGAPYKVNKLSSTKYTRPIAQLPKTVTVLSKEAIKDAGATDLSDVMKLQPGVTVGTGEGGNAFGDRYIIRGFEARNDVFVDGMRDPGVTVRDLFAVEQVEISKGPSSSFAGRGTTGGAVNNVTKKASFDDSFTRTEAGIGTDSNHRYTVDNNMIITDDLAIRTNLMYSERDIPKRGLASEQHQGVATAVEWWATDKFKINADYYYQATDDMPDGGVPWDAIAGKPVGGRKYYGQNGRDFWKTSSNIGTLGLEYNFADNLKVTNQTRLGRTTNDYVLTIPGLATPASVAASPGTFTDPIGLSSPGVFARASSQSRDQENNYLGNQLNLNWDANIAGMKHSFVFGTEVSKEEAQNLPYLDSVRSPNAGDPRNPDNNAWIKEGGSLTKNNERYAELEIDTISYYAMDTWTVNDDWELFGGLRYDTFDYRINSGPTAYTGATDGEVSKDDGFLNGHAGIVYSPWENGNVYASYSTSTNPTGEQIDAFTNCAYGGVCRDQTTGAMPKPEQNENFEVGTKWEVFDKKLLLTAAAFQTTKDNVISSVGNGATAAFTQVGQMRVRGIELGMAGNITQDLSGQFGVAFLDTEITKSDDPLELGKPFPNTAEESATLQLRYQTTKDLALGTTVSYVGEFEGGSPNSAGTGNTIDDRTRLDLMAEYALTDKAKLRLNIINVADTEYYEALYRSAAPFTYVGEGRSATLNLAYQF